MTESHRSLSIVKSGNGAGRVTSLPDGIDCGEACTAAFPLGSNVTLVATAAPGSRFAGFTDACEGKSPCTLQSDRDQAVGARFELLESGSDAGSADAGEVDAGSGDAGATDAGGMDAGFDAGSFDAGESDAGFTDAGATDAGGTDGGATDAGPVDAGPTLYALHVTVVGSGVVSSNPSGISCGGVCDSDFVDGTQVTLTPSASAPATFSGWSGACSGMGACTVTMNGARNVTASFAVLPASSWQFTSGALNPDNVQGASATPTGDLYFGGWFGVTNTTSTLNLGGTPLTVNSANGYLAKFDATGHHLWSWTLPSPGFSEVTSIATDPSGNALVAGQFQNSVTMGGTQLTTPGTDFFVAKVSPAGAVLWVKHGAGVGLPEGVQVLAAANGDAIVAARTWASTSVDGVSVTGFGAVYRLSGTNGSPVWGRAIAQGTNSSVIPAGIASDASGGIVVVGIFGGTVTFPFAGSVTAAGGQDMFVEHYDGSGTVQSAFVYGGTGSENALGVSVDGNALYLFGQANQYSGSSNIGGVAVQKGTGVDGFVAKTDLATGAVSWVKTFTTSGTSSLYVFPSPGWIAANGDLVMSASMKAYGTNATATFGSTQITSSGDTDFVQLHLSPSTGAATVDGHVAHAFGQMFRSPLGNRVVYGTQLGADFGVPPGPLPYAGDYYDDLLLAVLPP